MGTVLTVNGAVHEVEADGSGLLLDALRNEIGLNGPKYGCGLAQCGACTVLVDGTPARSCVMTLNALRGRAVTTLEGLARDGVLHPVQQGFVDGQGAQCGYCLNGMVMTIVGLLSVNPDPGEEQIRNALRHNLCRCGSHEQIMRSARLAVDLSKAALCPDAQAEAGNV